MEQGQSGLAHWPALKVDFRVVALNMTTTGLFRITLLADADSTYNIDQKPLPQPTDTDNQIQIEITPENAARYGLDRMLARMKVSLEYQPRAPRLGLKGFQECSPHAAQDVTAPPAEVSAPGQS